MSQTTVNWSCYQLQRCKQTPHFALWSCQAQGYASRCHVYCQKWIYIPPSARTWRDVFKFKFKIVDTPRNFFSPAVRGVSNPWYFSWVFQKKTPTRNTHNRKRPNLRTSNEVRLCSETPYLRPTGAFLFFCCFIETRCNFEMVAKHLMSVRSINIHRNMFRALVIIASVLSGKPLSTFTCCEDGFCGAA